MINAYINGLKNWKRWDGRTRRKDYWLYQICNLLAIFVLIGITQLFTYLEFTTLTIFSWIFLIGYCVLEFIPTLAITIRRLHDSERSGLYFLLNIMSSFQLFPKGSALYYLFVAISYIASIWFFVLTLLPGTKGPNKYGPDPRDVFPASENIRYGEYPDFRGD